MSAAIRLTEAKGMSAEQWQGALAGAMLSNGIELMPGILQERFMLSTADSAGGTDAVHARVGGEAWKPEAGGAGGDGAGGITSEIKVKLRTLTL
jgi:hypothetical protein